MEDSSLIQTHNSLDDLFRLIKTLRGENGCPWDKKQTPKSVGIYLIEEVFELVDAIESGNSEQIREELGDVLFHIVFMARMFEERQEFDLSQVARTITEKMIRRHPHVFGDTEVISSAEVVQNWHKIKLNEKKDNKKQSILDSVPAKLPALLRAYRVSDRVAKSGFELAEADENQKNPAAVADGLQTALKSHDGRLASRQFGDLMFTLINIARLAEIHPESALTGSVKIFEARFKKMEELMAKSKWEFDEISLEVKKRMWQKVKKMVPGMD
ncbi:Nucleoside triphosphate pyrophosphohydrolase MazG (EC [Olavius sp. associated proteobacterium Delta 1]|nr:Nucleoside triphosphate pyrophosphohydrolase MazG (EC [Olavius sp. associated proteobacterium Delta 1]